MQYLKRAVFLDRDGVINRSTVRNGKPYPPKNFLELEILPGVINSMKSLKEQGWLLIVITNQPDVARGTADIADVEEINQHLLKHLPIDEFLTCYHDNNDGCNCRKPKPGALYTAADNHGINLSASFMVGDRWSDIEAGKNAGCKTIFLDYNYNERRPNNYDHKTCSLLSASKIILRDYYESEKC